MKNQALDNLLKSWATRVQANDDHVTELSGNISRSLAGQKLLEDEVLVTSGNISRLWGRFAYAAAGVAVGFVLALAAMHTGLFRSLRENGAVQFARLDPEQIRARRIVFGEMDRLFAGQLRWVATSGDNVQMGLGTGQSIDTAPLTLVRLVVLRKAAGEQTWRQVWDTDIVARNEEYVEVAPNAGLANHLTVWVYPNADGTLVVESSIQLRSPVAVDSSSSSIVRAGLPVEIMALKTDDAEYRVKHGQGLAWWRDLGHVESGDPDVAYYRAFDDASEFWRFWLKRYVPRDGAAGERYTETGRAFWSTTPARWFVELLLAGYRGEVRQRGVAALVTAGRDPALHPSIAAHRRLTASVVRAMPGAP